MRHAARIAEVPDLRAGPQVPYHAPILVHLLEQLRAIEWQAMPVGVHLHVNKLLRQTRYLLWRHQKHQSPGAQHFVVEAKLTGELREHLILGAPAIASIARQAT